MNALTTSITYQEYSLPGFVKDGQIWIGAVALTAPLGLTDRNAIGRMIRRHPADFGPMEAQLLTAETAGGPQKQWFLSREGAEVLANKVGTAEGVAFRRWTFRQWQAWRAGGKPVNHVATTSVREPLTAQTKRVLDFLQAHGEPDHSMIGMIEGIRSGVIAVPSEAMLSGPVAKFELYRSLQSQAMRVRGEAFREGADMGYPADQLRAIAAAHRKFNEPSSLPQLPGLDGEDA